MIFFDRSVPKSVAEALKQVRSDVLWFEDHFRHDVKDIDWLAVAGANAWLVIARDKKIRTRPAERATLLASNVGCFIIHQNTNLTKWAYLKLIVGTLDRMEEFFANEQRPFICKVDSTGKFRLG